jgi:hypothetical protein
MATTSTGKHYPVGTDKVVDGDDAIRQLAIDVDTQPGAIAFLAANASVAQNAPFVLGKSAPGPVWTKELSGGVTLDDATGDFTVPVAGLYYVNLGVRWDNNVSGPNRLAWAETGPSGAGVRVSDWIGFGSNAIAKIVGGPRLVRLAAGGKLRLITFHDAAGALNVVGSATAGVATFFEFRLFGA